MNSDHLLRLMVYGSFNYQFQNEKKQGIILLNMVYIEAITWITVVFWTLLSKEPQKS